MPTISLKNAVKKQIADVSERVAQGGVDIIGVPTGFHKLDDITGGLRPDTVTIVGARPGVGKALAIDTPIPTPTGWTTMGDLNIGDKVFDEQGQVCSVTWVREIFEDDVQYRVTFSDGSYIDACADHKWFTTTRKSRVSIMDARRLEKTHRGTLPSIVTTQEIRDTLRTGWDNRINHAVPTTKPLQLPEVDLPIPPYVLGAWLGDGNSGSANLTSADDEIIQNILATGMSVHEVKGNDSRAKYYRLGGTKQRGGSMETRQHTLNHKLRVLGVLNNKHVPTCYLRASVEQRLELLKGLMDTDGYINAVCMCEIVQKNKVLAYQIKELVQSLGMRCNVRLKNAKIYDKDCGTVYRVFFRPTMQVFGLERKATKWFESRHLGTDSRYIVSVEPIEKVFMRCITVNSESHLFLAGEAMIPTHNSAFAMSMAMNMARKNYKVLFLSLEMSADLLAMRAIAGLAQVPSDMLEKGRLTDEEHKRVVAVEEVIEDLSFAIVDDTTDSEKFLEYTVEFQEKYGLDVLFVDYLSLFRDGNSFGDVERVGRISRNVREIARVCHIPVVALAQLNREVEKRENHMPVLSDLRSAGDLEQDAFLVLFPLRPHYYAMLENGEEELLAEKDAKIIVAKNRQGRTALTTATFYPNRMLWEQLPPSLVEPPSLAARVRRGRE